MNIKFQTKFLSNIIWETKVAFGGVYPSVDFQGRPMTGVRASKAGSKLNGGPFALTSIRPQVLSMTPPLKKKFLSTWMIC